MNWSRRDFFRVSATPAAGLCLAAAPEHALADQAPSIDQRIYTIGLSQYSLHRMFSTGKIDPLDYPQFAIDQFGIKEIDVFDRAMPPVNERLPFLEKVRSRSEQAGTNIFLMMVEPIRLVSDNPADRKEELNRFHRLVDQANVVGASFLRVFLDGGKGSLDRQTARSVDGLKRLADYAETKKVALAVEAGVGSCRNGLWLARVMKEVDHPFCGSMPDFGKFGGHDKYAGTAALMASANVISAKSHAFNEEGLELQSDYPKLFQVIVDAGFRGIVAIEYEGNQSEVEGVKATQKLLQRLQESLAT